MADVRPISALRLPPFPDEAWRGVFGEYRALIEDISECPLAFHFANILSLVSAELGDIVKLHEGKSTFLNFYIFCNGRSGTKKSTATDLVDEHLVRNWPSPAIHATFPSVSSGEGLIRILRQYPNTLLRYDEIADLFATAGRTGQRIEPILNAAFDARPLAAVVKRARESLTASDYYLNLMANGTPDHVRLELSEALFSGGLLNRFLVFAAEPTGRSLPVMGTPDIDGVKAVAAKIASICSAWRAVSIVRGSIRAEFSREALNAHSDWYNVHNLGQQQAPEMEVKPLTRLDVYAKKLATLYCLLESEPSDAPKIQPSHVEAALAVAGYCRASMLWTVAGWTGKKSVIQQSEKLAEERVEAYLQSNGCMRERYIYRDLHLGANECKRAVDALAAAGILTVINDRPRMIHYAERCKCFTPCG